MKKVLSILFVLTLAILLAGCKGDKEISGSGMIQDVNVRRAISMAIDKAYYTDTILANESYPADYYIPYNFYGGIGDNGEGVDFRVRAEQVFGDFLPFTKYDMPAGSAESQSPSGYNHYNIEEAKQLWEDSRKRFGIEKDETVVFKMLVHNTASWTSLYDHVKAEIEKNLTGTKIKIISVTFGEKLDKAPTGDFDILFSGWGPDYMDPITYLDLFVTGNGHNNIHYSNPEYDYLINQAKIGAFQGQERLDAYVRAEKILLQDDVALLPIFQSNSVGLRRTQLQNFYTQSVGPDYILKWVSWDTTDDAWAAKEADLKAARIDGDETVLKLLETSKIPDMASFTTTDQVSFYNLAQINEGLMVAGNPQSNEQYLPGMAESYTVSEDGKVYTFTLREDQPWVKSDGTQYNNEVVTAEDFVFAWRKLADPRVASEYSYLLETIGVKGWEIAYEDVTDMTDAEIDTELAKLGVEATGEFELTVTLNTAADYFLGMMSFPSFYPVNEAFYTSLGEDYGKTLTPENLLYNGAYYLSNWDNNGHTLQKSDLYWDKDTVSIDKVIYELVESAEPEVQVQMYLDGDIDSVILRTGALVETYGARSDVRTTGSTTAWYLEFNINNH